MRGGEGGASMEEQDGLEIIMMIRFHAAATSGIGADGLHGKHSGAGRFEVVEILTVEF